MNLRNIDIEGGLRRLGERRIEEAMREGKFDNLPGKGQPLELEPMPAEENARMAWWALRLMKRHDFTPDEVRWRKQVDQLQEELMAAKSEPRVCFLVQSINVLVRRINTLGTNALQAPLAPVSVEAELERFRRGAVS